jgi:hypothetical protein
VQGNPRLQLRARPHHEPSTTFTPSEREQIINVAAMTQVAGAAGDAESGVALVDVQITDGTNSVTDVDGVRAREGQGCMMLRCDGTTALCPLQPFAVAEETSALSCFQVWRYIHSLGSCEGTSSHLRYTDVSEVMTSLWDGFLPQALFDGQARVDLLVEG